ncbi:MULTISPECIES: DUF4091 domain-containing protein [Paenibacillus]|uniref:Glycoside hydrolase 123 catalytic domain-containing protein n=1 Tax=Paenibacillus albilobatus TaxID=2716884 RepID=A0A920CEG7_9BACL|nr:MULTISPECIES: DUF4091 domain-containing protein [Paenibacillus]GIO33909.1 hypothetical protein J2TS6_50500 [Paenibacillus albilobatus]
MKFQVFSANEWVYPDQTIADPPERELRIRIAGVRGSYAGCQVLFNDLPPQAELTWTFRGRSWPEERPPCEPELRIYRLIDVQVNENTDVDVSTVPAGTPAPPYVTRQAPFRVYDALLPVGRQCSAGSSTEAYYLCWHIPAQAAPGIFGGDIILAADNQTCIIPVQIEVFKAIIPEQGRLHVTNWFSTRNIAERYGLEPWSEAFWSMLEQYGLAMRRCRQTHFLVNGSFVDVKPHGEGRYTFDFSKAERLITLFLKLGFTHIEGGHVANRLNWEDPTFVLNADPSVQATSREGYVFLSQYLKAWREWLESKGWLSLLVQHVADEPIEPSAADYRILSGIVRKWLPGVPLIDAVINTGVAGAVDIWVPTNKEYELHQEDYEGYRKCGDTLWFYTCWNPGGDYLNRFLDFPLLKTRYLHWGNFKYGLDGYLHWGFNYYFKNQDPFELTNPLLAPDVHDRRVPAGDTHIVYPGPDGPLLSMRLEAMRAGVEDYELLRDLRDHRPELAEDILSVCMNSFTEVNTDPSAFDQAYRRLLEAVSEYTP